MNEWFLFLIWFYKKCSKLLILRENTAQAPHIHNNSKIRWHDNVRSCEVKVQVQWFLASKTQQQLLFWKEKEKHSVSSGICMNREYIYMKREIDFFKQLCIKCRCYDNIPVEIKARHWLSAVLNTKKINQ